MDETEDQINNGTRHFKSLTLSSLKECNFKLTYHEQKL